MEKAVEELGVDEMLLGQVQKCLAKKRELQEPRQALGQKWLCILLTGSNRITWDGRMVRMKSPDPKPVLKAWAEKVQLRPALTVRNCSVAIFNGVYVRKGSVHKAAAFCRLDPETQHEINLYQADEGWWLGPDAGGTWLRHQALSKVPPVQGWSKQPEMRIEFAKRQPMATRKRPRELRSWLQQIDSSTQGGVLLQYEEALNEELDGDLSLLTAFVVKGSQILDRIDESLWPAIKCEKMAHKLMLARAILQLEEPAPCAQDASDDRFLRPKSL